MFYSHLQALSPPRWSTTLSRKLDSFECLAGQLVTIDDSCVSRLAQALTKLGPRVAAAVIKTWANVWTTSTRMHEPIPLPCIFGCEGCSDTLNHYLTCDILWTAVISCSFGRTELLRPSPFITLGLDGSFERLQMLAIAFSSYHALKMSHHAELITSLACGHPCQVQDRLIGYAKVFAKEVLE